MSTAAIASPPRSAFWLPATRPGTGVAYGLNPLFAKPLINAGASIESILFFRYTIAVLLLGGYLLIRKESFKISLRQSAILLALGLLFTASSTFLFESYKYIASGLATTLVFLFPVLVAIIMVFLNFDEGL